MLREFQEEIENCQKCSLGRSRTNLVFGTGDEKAKIIFVGEAPGYYEDQKGEPFVGAAGKLLTGLLEKIGLKRSDVYIANVLKCRPPENRNPSPEEIEACKPYLLKQIEIIKPKVVCTLGNFATQTILGKKVPITKVKARPAQVKDFLVFPLYHPAAALHQGWMRGPLEEDFYKLKDFLDSGIEPEPVIEDPEQLDLF
ncbi:MAG: uracil-DNA glycosylase [Nitrospirae bacterium]|nr:uracil-DNA glycosylase [Nitrospirota bacterium]